MISSHRYTKLETIDDDGVWLHFSNAGSGYYHGSSAILTATADYPPLTTYKHTYPINFANFIISFPTKAESFVDFLSVTSDYQNLHVDAHPQDAQFSVSSVRFGSNTRFAKKATIGTLGQFVRPSADLLAHHWAHLMEEQELERLADDNAKQPFVFRIDLEAVASESQKLTMGAWFQKHQVQEKEALQVRVAGLALNFNIFSLNRMLLAQFMARFHLESLSAGESLSLLNDIAEFYGSPGFRVAA
jgi:hypothetical protein